MFLNKIFFRTIKHFWIQYNLGEKSEYFKLGFLHWYYFQHYPWRREVVDQRTSYNKQKNHQNMDIISLGSYLDFLNKYLISLKGVYLQTFCDASITKQYNITSYRCSTPSNKGLHLTLHTSISEVSQLFLLLCQHGILLVLQGPICDWSFGEHTTEGTSGISVRYNWVRYKNTNILATL